LRQRHPASVVTLMRIQGLGPKVLHRLRAELGIQSIEIYGPRWPAQAARPQGLREKSEDKLGQALARSRRRARSSAPRSRSRCRWPTDRGAARRRAGVSQALVCGRCAGSARPSATSTFLVAADAGEPVMEALVAMSFVDRVLVRGAAKTSVVTRRGTQIDVRVVPAHQIGAAASTSPAARGTTSSCGSAR